MRSSNLEYSEPLDHLRLLACLLVTLFHTYHPVYANLTNSMTSYFSPVNPLSVFYIDGHTGVGLFLTLSGFLFARICRQGSISVKNFYLNRFLRIYPLLVLILLMAIFFGNVPNPWPSFMCSLLALHNTPMALQHPCLAHLWTISVECQFYLLFPLLLWLYRCEFGLSLLALFIGMDIFALAVCYLSDGQVLSLAYSTILGRVNQCIIGMMLGFSLEKFEARLRHPVYLALSLSVLSGLLIFFHNSGGTVSGLRHPVWIVFPTLEGLAWGAVIVTYMCCSQKLPTQLSRVLALGGALSYSIYVWHFYFCIALYPIAVTSIMNFNHGHSWLLPFQKTLFANPAATSLLIGLFVVFPATVFFSIFTYKFIEMPFFNLRRKYVFKMGDSTEIEPTARFSFQNAKRRALSASTRVLKISGWSAACIFICALGCELACRASGLPASAYLQPDQQLGFRLIPGKVVEWKFEGYSHDPISRAGFRDIDHDLEKRPGVRRVLILGNSAAEGLQVPLNKIAARRLQQMLDSDNGTNVEVINASCSSYSLGQLTALYDQIADAYKPDEVFLLYDYGSSLTSIRNPHDYSVMTRPYFYLNNNVLVEDSSLLPSKSFCTVTNLSLKHSSFANFLFLKDFEQNLKNSAYQGMRAGVLSVFRKTFCRRIDYPVQDSSEVRNALLSFLNRVVRLNGSSLTVFTLPSRKLAAYDKDYREVSELSLRQGFSVVELSNVYEKVGPKAFLKYHFSELGHEVLAGRMYSCLRKKNLAVAGTFNQTKLGSKSGGLPL